ncbi:MAG: arsenate reductase family protein [Bacillota bacterium]
MDDFVIYEKPTCSKCRAASALLDAAGRPYRRIRYHEERIPAEKLRELIVKSGLPPQEFVRTKEDSFKKLKRPVSQLSLDDIVSLLAADPDLIERPILECGSRVTLGRPTERAAAFIAECSR